MTAAGVRVPHARLIVVLVAAAVCAALLWLTRTYTFYFDEWVFITTAPGWTLASYFEPHNEHPTMLLKVTYALLLNTIGLRTYLPYMTAALLAHFANVVLLFAVVRRRAGDLVGLAAAFMLLFLGAGWENLLWAFQMGWLAGLAFGLGAMLVLPRRPWLAAALLTVALSFVAGTGIIFAIAAAVELALTPSRRRQILWLVPPAVALAVWYVAFGRFGAHPNPPPSAANVLLVPLYAAWGLSQGVAGLIGAGGWIGWPLLALAIGVVGWRWRTKGVDAFAIGIAAGLVAFYVVAGLTRAQLGWQQSGAGRYVYVAAMLWLILLADAAKDLPWRGTWRPALAALVFLACFNSSVLLFEYAAAKAAQMERASADLQALATERADPCLDQLSDADPLIMPGITAAAYYAATDRYGDPVAGHDLADRGDFEAARGRLRLANC